MNKKTTLALVVFVAMAAIAYYLLTLPEKGVRTGDKARPFPKIVGKEIKEVTIVSNGKTVVLKKQNDVWKVGEPVDYPADENATKTLVDKLEKMEFGDLVTEKKEKHAELELTKEKGAHVTISDGKKALADFYVGKVQSGYTMIRNANKDQVFQAVGSLKHVFNKELKNWRNRQISKFKADEAVKLDMQSKEGRIVLSRKDSKAPWKVEKSPVKIDQLDESIPKRIVSSISSLSAADFADKPKPDETGLDNPQGVVTVTLKDKKSVEVKVGNKQKDDYWVQKAGEKQIYMLRKHSVKNLLTRPIDFRNKDVLSFNADDAISYKLTKWEKGKKTTINLNKKGKGWMGNSGKKLKDSKKLEDAIKTLSKFKASGFAVGSSTDYGLNKPEAVIEIGLKDRSVHVLTVGSVEKDGLKGVMRKGLSDVFAFRKYGLKKVILDPANYQ